VWEVFSGDFVFRQFSYDDIKEAIEYAQGKHPEAPRYEGDGVAGATVRSKVIPAGQDLYSYR